METNKIYNECCLETMERMDDNSIDLVVTSPPYNMRLRIRNGKYTTKEKSEHFSKKYTHFGDDLPIDEFYKFHKHALAEMLRVSKIVLYNFQIVTGSKAAFLKIIGDFNEYIKDIMVWDKGHGQPAMHSNVLNSAFEIILVLERNKKAGRVIENSTFERGTMSNILRTGRGKRKSGSGHRAVFPENLIQELLSSFSRSGDIVYDPFTGTGTTAKMAISLNRKYIGSEVSKEYCQLAKKRIQDG